MAEQAHTIEDYIDVDKLTTFLRENLPGPDEPLDIKLHTAGFSNVTVMINRGDQKMVMRRPPLGHLLPKAHDVIREYNFLSALYGRARVPKPLVACDDVSVIGAPFYLMERVPGSEIRTEIPAPYDNPEGRRAMTGEFIDTLVELHAIDWTTTGLYGKPEGFLQRQIDLWRRQLGVTQERTRVLPGFMEIADWLDEHKPESSEASVLHGDYKLDNQIWSLTEPKLLAMVDWELATIGDPLFDAGYILASWADPGERAILEEAGYATDPPSVTLREGFPRRQGLAELYAERSGRATHDLLFYMVLAMFKLAVIIEGIYMRAIEGNVVNPMGRRYEFLTPLRVEYIHRIIDSGKLSLE